MKRIIVVLTALLMIFNGTTAEETSTDTVIADNFERVFYNPSAHIGETMIWGGTIIDLSKVPTGAEIVIREIPLDYLGKLEGPDYSRGRFIVRSDDSTFIERFSFDDLVVVTGVVQGSLSRPLGKDKQYTYPILSARVVHPCYREHAYRYQRKNKKALSRIDGPFCVDPETNQKHRPTEHHEYRNETKQ